MSIREYQEQSGATENKDYGRIATRMSSDMMVQLMHAQMGMTTEIGEFTDVLKRYSIYGKEIDRVNLSEELGDMMWYLALAARALNVDLAVIMEQNLEKLRKRFPDKFSEFNALNRDIDNELSHFEP